MLRRLTLRYEVSPLSDEVSPLPDEVSPFTFCHFEIIKDSLSYYKKLPSEEPCDERGGEGWLGKVASERFGTVGVTTKSIGVDGAIHNFTYHFVLEEVLRWRPLK